jgi:hypothetical protein
VTHGCMHEVDSSWNLASVESLQLQKVLQRDYSERVVLQLKQSWLCHTRA